MRKHIPFDKPLAAIIGLLVFFGAMIFLSAAFGSLARGSSHISSVVFNHLVLGVSLGLLTLFVMALFDYRRLRSWAPYLFGGALLATALVFVPGLGMEHGGGTRWLDLGVTTFQPSELLKIGAVLMMAAVCATLRERVASWCGLAAFGGVIALPVALLIMQPDIGTLGIVCISVFAVYLAAGARWRDIGIVVLVGLIAFGVLASVRPYMRDRILTFIDPANNPHQEDYQIIQSLRTIGAGGFAGRGFGQGVQKFKYLPEPMGDSIFAVAAEETGFLGGTALIGLFLVLALRGFTVASRAPDLFGALAAVGVSVYFVSEAFINVAAMLGLVPLTGIPLTFISHGGSAMLVSLASAGILLAISRRKGNA